MVSVTTMQNAAGSCGCYPARPRLHPTSATTLPRQNDEIAMPSVVASGRSYSVHGHWRRAPVTALQPSYCSDVPVHEAAGSCRRYRVSPRPRRALVTMQTHRNDTILMPNVVASGLSCFAHGHLRYAPLEAVQPRHSQRIRM